MVKMRSTTDGRGPETGLAMTEIIMVVAVVLVLVLGSLYLFDPGGNEEGPYVAPWRIANADYASRAVEIFRTQVQAFYDQNAALPGDQRDAGYTNSTGSVLGNEDGRIEKGNEEYLKVFRDLRLGGETKNKVFLVRGRPLYLYWMRVQRGDGSVDEGHYARVDGFNTAEAMAMDRRKDDGDKSMGDILYFPYKEDTDFSTLLVKFNLFQ